MLFLTGLLVGHHLHILLTAKFLKFSLTTSEHAASYRYYADNTTDFAFTGRQTFATRRGKISQDLPCAVVFPK